MISGRDCQIVYFRTEFNYQKKSCKLHEIRGDVTPNKDQLPVLQQIWKKFSRRAETF